MTEDRFKIGIHGLSKDMEDFICEQADYYFDKKHEFWTSFWKVCTDMWSNGKDLSDKQLEIIYKEYDKVKKERI
jgi:hypothetical protein